jgi:hypothetical protein
MIDACRERRSKAYEQPSPASGSVWRQVEPPEAALKAAAIIVRLVAGLSLASTVVAPVPDFVAHSVILREF